jgi:hypothetical protein
MLIQRPLGLYLNLIGGKPTPRLILPNPTQYDYIGNIDYIAIGVFPHAFVATRPLKLIERQQYLVALY